MAHVAGHDQNYYLDQVCSIGVCGAMGIISILMYTSNKLSIILVPAFHKPVLWGGIVVLIIAVVRFTALWRMAGTSTHHHDHDGACHDHDHDHHDHKHDEKCGGHDCGHDHSHAWTPAKYAVLLLPVVLYLLELPNASFSADRISRDLVTTELEGSDRVVENKGALKLGYRELADACHDSAKRAYFEGHMVELRGIYMPLNSETEFTLVRLNMNCCAADAIPMQVRIISPTSVRFAQGEWVATEGKVEFRKAAGKEKWFAVLLLESPEKVRSIPPEPNPYAY